MLTTPAASLPSSAPAGAEEVASRYPQVEIGSSVVSIEFDRACRRDRIDGENRMRSGSVSVRPRSPYTRPGGWGPDDTGITLRSGRDDRCARTRWWPSAAQIGIYWPRKSATSAPTACTTEHGAQYARFRCVWRRFMAGIRWMIRILRHGISLGRKWSVTHPHDMPPSQFPPSPTFRNSLVVGLAESFQ